MRDYEKLGAFYLGKMFDMKAGELRDDLLLYDSKDLTTHAVCVGMTGSGKTGLCLSLLEEAAIDGIPAICIDPKGDIGNLLLTFLILSQNSSSLGSIVVKRHERDAPSMSMRSKFPICGAKDSARGGKMRRGSPSSGHQLI